jgi:iron complex outermembrane receptor protein/hemoglobin/transferrin/lactoferrin receptor protein
MITIYFKIKFIRRYLALLLIALWPATVTAQQTKKAAGSISGTVKDVHGHTLPGVNVAVLKLQHGAATIRGGAATNSKGQYTIRNLQPGTYTISFSFIGFTTIKKQIKVSAGQEQILNVALKESLTNLSQLVVTGTATATSPLKAPAEINSLSGINKFVSTQTSLGASLEKLAGVSTIESGPTMGKPVIHGLHGDRISVVSNGTRMDFEQFGSDHGPNVDPFIAKKIEVVQGAASVQYGSNALGGAVNIISRPVPYAVHKSSSIGGEIMSSFATNNGEYSGGIHLHGASGRLGFTGTFVKRNAGDVHTPGVATFNQTGNPGAPLFSGKLNHTDFDQLNGSFALGYKTSSGPVTARFNSWHSNQNMLNPNGDGEGQNLANQSVQVKGDFNLGNDFELKPKFSFNSNLRQESDKPRNEMPKHGFTDLDLLIHSYVFGLKLQHPAIGPFQGTAAVTFHRDDRYTRGQEPLVPSGIINNFGGYLFEKADFNRLTLAVGLRVDAIWQHADPNKKLNLPDYNAGETNNVLRQTYTAFSGSLGATYSITDHLIIAANAGRGFRAPSFYNLYAYGTDEDANAFAVGESYLHPEHSIGTQFSLRWHSTKVQASVTGFRNYIKNYIYFVNTGNFTNSKKSVPILKATQGSARLLGIDAHIKTQATHWLQFHGTFSLVKGRNVDDEIDIRGLPMMPANTLSGGIKLTKEHVGPLQMGFIGLSAKHAFQKNAAGPYEPFWQIEGSFKSGGFELASTDAYTLLNASLGFKLPLWNRPISFVITAKNLLNTAYRAFLNTHKGYVLNPGREITFKVKIPFGTR